MTQGARAREGAAGEAGHTAGCSVPQPEGPCGPSKNCAMPNVAGSTLATLSRMSSSQQGSGGGGGGSAEGASQRKGSGASGLTACTRW